MTENIDNEPWGLRRPRWPVIITGYVPLVAASYEESTIPANANPIEGMTFTPDDRNMPAFSIPDVKDVRLEDHRGDTLVVVQCKMLPWRLSPFIPGRLEWRTPLAALSGRQFNGCRCCGYRFEDASYVFHTVIPEVPVDAPAPAEPEPEGSYMTRPMMF